MLTRFVRIQLTIFTIASVIGVLVMVFAYLQPPTLLGIGKMTVTLELPETGGLYRFSNVTYRGVEMGKVTSVGLTPTGAKATLSLNTSPKVPADVQADVRSISAVGEQYVDLRPRTDSGPYLKDGSVIHAENTTIPQAVGPMLDQVSALINSIPKDRLSDLLDESYKGFNGAGDDLRSLADSSATLSSDINGVADRARALTDDSGPLLDSQVETTDAIRTWARSLANVTQTVANDDPQVRTLLETGSGAANEASALLTQVKPTLPVLLANLTSLGQVLVTYHPGLEQLLVLLPPTVAATEAFGPKKNPTGVPMGDFAITISDPPACTVGFLPPSQWRSPADMTTIDTPDGLYCKMPQDSPLNVRGARNIPCMGKPGKRAPTVEICDSDKPFEPLAMRPHVTGPAPFDPNTIAQGVPPDDRVNFGDQIFAPTEGTPMPPGALPPGGPPPPASPAGGEQLPPAPDQAPLPPGNSLNGVPIPPAPPAEAVPAQDGGAPVAAPSSFTPNGPGSGPSVAVAQYNPKTGVYVSPDGHAYQQSDLVSPGTPKSWKDMLPT
ncbi:MAG: phospholipid/cholesterol/gamma-HCH transport system substrate-binding protein [Mycobacterium sp.]|nr:phospholipid/cholesterol/gamma-HCH transport system substrate-binding protein [Mycobacterium sp.]